MQKQIGIHLSPAYQDYTLGKPLEGIVQAMVDFVHESDGPLPAGFDPESMLYPEKIREKLIIRSFSYRKNMKTLENFIYHREGDIAPRKSTFKKPLPRSRDFQ
ncbi:MAG: hypothetical protein FWF59_03875 [Turicibacter sp.]|nr:hypothetical protein [Turicibacter sp.]